MEKNYRVYFNKRQPDGLIWSVDDGDQANEIIVKKVVIRNVRMFTDSGPGDNINSPTVWLAVEGAHLHVIEDIAYLMP